MSAEKIDMALAFLHSHVDEAVAILEQQPMDQVAQFLDHIPLDQATAVLQKMLPQYAARLIKSLSTSTSASAGLLANMEISFIVAIIRHSESDFKPQLMKLLPDKTKIACRLLLNYAEDAVGAWMVTNTITLPDSCTVEEALARLIDDKETTILNTIYIVDRARLIKGSVTNINLLRAMPNSPISQVMNKTVESISARTSLISASSYSVWNQLDTVPLINRHKQLVGVLRHSDLRKGLNQISTSITPSDNTNPVSAIFEIYSHSLVALLNTVTEVTHQGQQSGKPS